MRKPVLALAGIALLAACDVTMQGSGATTTRRPVTLELHTTIGALDESFSISSFDGWYCTGALTREQAKITTSAVIQVPLFCGDGVTGTAVLSSDVARATVIVNFQLSNGITGTAKAAPNRY